MFCTSACYWVWSPLLIWTTQKLLKQTTQSPFLLKKPMDEPFWDSKIYWKNLALPVALCCYWANRRVLVKSNPNHHILIWTWQVKNRSLQLSSQAIWLNHTLCAVLQKPDRLIQYISTTSQQQEASLIVLKHSLGWNQKDLCQRIDSDADYGGIRARMKTSLFGGTTSWGSLSTRIIQ